MNHKFISMSFKPNIKHPSHQHYSENNHLSFISHFYMIPYQMTNDSNNQRILNNFTVFKNMKFKFSIKKRTRANNIKFSNFILYYILNKL